MADKSWIGAGNEMTDSHYCWEVFSRATHILSVDKGEVKERLAKAATEISILDSQSLPDEVRYEYNELMQALSAKGTIRETISVMRKERATATAERIVTIEAMLREICYAES